MKRVSKAFHTTIQGSTKLKRLMFLEPRDDNPWADLYYPDHRPLLFLCGCIEDGNVQGVYWGMFVVFLNNLDLHAPYEDGLPILQLVVGDEDFDHDSIAHQLISTFTNGWERADASWRNIRICNSTHQKPIRLLTSVDAIHEKPNIGEPNAIWLLSGDTTLGQVLELVRGFLEFVDQRRAEKKRADTAFEAATLARMTAKLGTGAAVSTIDHTRY